MGKEGLVVGHLSMARLAEGLGVRGTPPTTLHDDAHVEVEATWGIYQRMIAAYREEDRASWPRTDGQAHRVVGAEYCEGARRGHHAGPNTEEARADVLAYFDRPGTSNGPTEAINGRLEHLRGSALGFRNLTNYIARSLLETGGFRPQLLPPSAVKRPQPAVSTARASLVSSTEKRSGCQSWGSQSRISSAPSPMGVARGSYPPRTHSASSS